MQLVRNESGEYDDSVPISFQREIEILRAASVNSLLIRPEARNSVAKLPVGMAWRAVSPIV